MTDNSSLLEGEAVLVRMTLTTCFRELHANLGQDSVYMTSIMSQGPTLSGWESLLTPYSSHKLARANGVSHFCLSPGLVSMVIAIFHLPFLCLKTLRNRTTCALQNNTRPRAWPVSCELASGLNCSHRDLWYFRAVKCGWVGEYVGVVTHCPHTWRPSDLLLKQQRQQSHFGINAILSGVPSEARESRRKPGNIWCSVGFLLQKHSSISRQSATGPVFLLRVQCVNECVSVLSSTGW